MALTLREYFPVVFSLVLCGSTTQGTGGRIANAETEVEDVLRHILLTASSLLALNSLAIGNEITGSMRTAALPKTACAGWDRIGSMTIDGSTEQGGLTGALAVTVDTRTGRYVVSRDYGLYSQAEGFDGELGWSRDRSGASHYLNSSSARAISATLAWLTRRGWCSPTLEGAGSMSLPDETNTGIVESVWEVTPRSGISAVLRFDRISGLPRSFEIRFPFNRLIRHFGDWRRGAGGVWVPWSQRDEDPEDESVENVTVRSIHTGRGSPQMAFANMPPLPSDFGIVDQTLSTEVGYEDDGIGRIYIPVLINGQGPFAFEVDTGGHLIVTEQTAMSLHLSAAGSMSSSGGGSGVVHGGLVRTGEIRIGSAVIRNQVAKVLPLPEATNDRGSRLPRAGILGLELFERFVVQLDRTRKTLTLAPMTGGLGAPRGVALPLYFNEDAPMVQGTYAGVAGEFELDTGNAGPAIVEAYWARQHGLDQHLRGGIPWKGGGVGGEYGETLSRGDLAIGPLGLPHEVVSYIGATDRGSESTRMQAGVIGESTLRRFDITFDYGHARVWIDSEPKAPPIPFNRAGLRVARDSPDSFKVTFVVPDSPAAGAGFKPGDRILTVDTLPATKLAQSDISLICSGPVGSKVDILVRANDGSTELRSFRLMDVLP
jgi:hypothetical protein